MSERRSAADLGAPAEAALAVFPFPERDWEQDARAVEARLSPSVRGATDALLLAAPLPSEPGEPSTFSATTTPLTNSGVRTQSLADMARRSVEQKQTAERQMARESLALAAQSRPSSEEAAVLREAVSAVRASAPPPVTAPRASVAASVPVAPPALAPAAPQRRSSLPLLGLGAGGIALAAAVLLWLRQPAPTPLVANAVATETTQTRAESPVAASPTPSSGSARGAAVVAAADAPVAVDPSTLSKEGAALAPPDPKRAKTAAVTSSAPPAASASSAGPSPDKIVLEDDQGSPMTAAAEKPDKALPPDPALRPADSTGGSMPVKPSSGAVQAALGAVMSGARHCVAGDEAASSAVVVFGSDGHVTSVTVSGPAGGKPAGACIQGQLSRARVQPFAASSFSINATVRPD